MSSSKSLQVQICSAERHDTALPLNLCILQSSTSHELPHLNLTNCRFAVLSDLIQRCPYAPVTSLLLHQLKEEMMVPTPYTLHPSPTSYTLNLYTPVTILLLHQLKEEMMVPKFYTLSPTPYTLNFYSSMTCLLL